MFFNIVSLSFLMSSLKVPSLDCYRKIYFFKKKKKIKKKKKKKIKKKKLKKKKIRKENTKKEKKLK